MVIESGTQVGTFVIDSLVGDYGILSVYKAYQGSNNFPVFLKIITNVSKSGDPDWQDRIKQHLANFTTHHHPVLMPIWEYGTQGDFVFYSSPYPEGTGVESMIGKFAIPEELASSLISQVGAGLQFLHQMNIVVGDLQPGNIVMDTGGFCHLSHWEVFTLLKEISDDTEKPVFGDAQYQAPEFLFHQPIQVASDIYSLGLIAYALYAGQTPFLKDTPRILLLRQAFEELPGIQTRHPGISDFQSRAITTAILKSPFVRFQSATDFLQWWGLGIQKSIPTAVPEPGKKKKPWIFGVVLLALILLVLCAVGAVFGIQKLNSDINLLQFWDRKTEVAVILDVNPTRTINPTKTSLPTLEPTATLTITPIPTATPAPTEAIVYEDFWGDPYPTGPSGYQLTFYDSFTDDNYGWDVIDEDYGSAESVNGQYLIQPQTWFIYDTNIHYVFDNFYTELSANISDASGDYSSTAFNFIFGAAPDNSFFNFSYLPDGTYNLSYINTNNELSTVIDWTDNSMYTPGLDIPILFTFQYENGNFRVWVNDIQIVDQPVYGYKSGRIGLGCNSYDGPGNSCSVNWIYAYQDVTANVRLQPLYTDNLMVYEGQSIEVNYGWGTLGENYINDFIKAAVITVEVDGVVLTPSDAGQDENNWGVYLRGENDWLGMWAFPLGSLPLGIHTITIDVSLSQNIEDGYDGDGDGLLDIYPKGSLSSGTATLEVVKFDDIFGK